MKMTWKTTAIAAAAFASAMVVTLGFADKAEARRLYVGRGFFAVNAIFHPDASLPWNAVRAYYLGGPWSGACCGGGYYSWAGWSDYKTRNGIGCDPGSIVKGGDGIWYNCQ